MTIAKLPEPAAKIIGSFVCTPQQLCAIAKADVWRWIREGAYPALLRAFEREPLLKPYVLHAKILYPKSEQTFLRFQALFAKMADEREALGLQKVEASPDNSLAFLREAAQRHVETNTKRFSKQFLPTTGLGRTSLALRFPSKQELKKLGFCILTRLPSDIRSFKALTKLEFQANRLWTLPPEIGSLKELRELTFHDCELTALPEEIGDLTQLEKLSVPQNLLQELPASLVKLTQLKELMAFENQLHSLPSLKTLTNLESLSLLTNRLASLSPDIAACTKLKKLHLGDNCLATLPKELVDLPALETLAITGNAFLEDLPAEFFNSDRLVIQQALERAHIEPPEKTDLSFCEWIGEGICGFFSCLAEKVCQILNCLFCWYKE